MNVFLTNIPFGEEINSEFYYKIYRVGAFSK
jgi:hypothetical protein